MARPDGGGRRHPGTELRVLIQGRDAVVFHRGRIIDTSSLPRLALAAVLCLVLAACARKAPVVAPGPDHYPDFPYPRTPAELENTPAAVLSAHEQAWRTLQAGDPRGAERGFTAALARRADFYPAETGLGYVEVARGNDRKALDHFDRVVTRAPDYLPAVLGRGQTYLRLERPEDALSAFEHALALDPSLPDLRGRVESLRFRVLEASLAEARRAEQAGRLDDARALFARASAASPDSAFLYRDLARIESRLGRADEALSHATRAVTLDPGDRASWLLIADIHEQRTQLEETASALEKAQAIESTPDIAQRLTSVRSALALARLPQEYRDIAGRERLTRGELAALLGVRFEPLLQTVTAAATGPMTDTSRHWAQPWILTVARARVMEAFPNHTFQPGAPVRRGDLARAATAVLALVAQRDPALGRNWMTARQKFSDLDPRNLYYPAASVAVAAGVMSADGDRFDAGRVVSGAEAIDTVDRLEKVVARMKGLPRG